MRENPNKVIKVIKKENKEEYIMFLTGKFLSLYLLLFNVSARDQINKNTCELHAYGQTKAVRFFCDKKEIEELLCDKRKNF